MLKTEVGYLLPLPEASATIGQCQQYRSKPTKVFRKRSDDPTKEPRYSLISILFLNDNSFI